MRSILLAVIMLYSANVSAAGFENENDAQSFAAHMVSLFVQEKFEQSFNEAKLHWPLPSVEIDGIVNSLKTQWPIVQNRFGAPIGQEFVRSERIGDSFRRYYFLHKFENHAIYWRFDFYRGSKNWMINSVVFLDLLDPLYAQ